jgi:signal transduction histidine kinase
MRRRKTAVFFLVLGIILSSLAVLLNIGWILLNLREVALLIFGVIFFAIIITGLILNTIFLLREIRRNEQHDAFLNAVTHELKTPIASIKLYLDTLKSRELSREKQQEFYDIMLADNERLLGTVEQVLQASRAREKQREMNLSDVDLAEVIRETTEKVRAQQHLDESAIRLTVPPDAVRVLGDRGELQTAITNLLDNAIKYSAEKARISVRLKSTGSEAEVFIRDNGLGIARGDLKRIFKRFYRVHNKGVEVKGTGLGLPIVRSIVERHGGRIKAESRGLGKGTTFVIQLPRI